MTIQTTHVILASGESLTAEEVMQAFLLLARAEAGFPFIGERDVHLASLMLIPELLAYNNEEEIV